MEEKDAAEKKITVPEVKKLLESMGEENLDQLQRRTYDYVSKFSKMEADEASKMVDRLIKEFEIDEDEAIQIVNCMPKTVDELRAFLAGGRKIIETAKLETVLNLLNEHRKAK